MEECSNCKYAEKYDIFLYCENKESCKYDEIVRSDSTCSEWEVKENERS